MPIQEITTDEVVQQCARCGNENRVPLASLTVGVARDQQADENVVPLPPCPTCASSEFLLRSPSDEPDHPVPGSIGHLHRLLVDHVHAELVKRGNVIEELRAKLGEVRLRPVSTVDMATWFKRGLKMPAQAVEVAPTTPERAPSR